MKSLAGLSCKNDVKAYEACKSSVSIGDYLLLLIMQMQKGLKSTHISLVVRSLGNDTCII